MLTRVISTREAHRHKNDNFATGKCHGVDAFIENRTNDIHKVHNMLTSAIKPFKVE